MAKESIPVDANIVSHSIAPHGGEIMSVEMSYWRCVHAEHLRHREQSFSVQSNRAVPAKKVRGAVLWDPYMPVEWPSEQRGMVGGGELAGIRRWLAKLVWKMARFNNVAASWSLDALGLHKSIGNRLLEPWQRVRLIVTATQWDNFLSLRVDRAAEPNIRYLAAMLARKIRESEPVRIPFGGWHAPYIRPEERYQSDEEMCNISAARCARVSYLPYGEKALTTSCILRDRDLAKKLASQLHVSPFEHQATPLDDRHGRSGNFIGWEQNRKRLPKDVHTSFDRWDEAESYLEKKVYF